MAGKQLSSRCTAIIGIPDNDVRKIRIGQRRDKLDCGLRNVD